MVQGHYFLLEEPLVFPSSPPKDCPPNQREKLNFVYNNNQSCLCIKKSNFSINISISGHKFQRPWQQTSSLNGAQIIQSKAATQRSYLIACSSWSQGALQFVIRAVAMTNGNLRVLRYSGLHKKQSFINPHVGFWGLFWPRREVKVDHFKAGLKLPLF